MESELNLAEHGDLLERDNADYVRARFISYEQIWSAYIGNNGRAQALKLVGASKEQVELRDECAQRVYTVLQSMVCMKRLCDNVAGREFPRFVSISNDDERILQYHLVTVNDFMAFHAHAGRVRDVVKKIGELWSNPQLAKNLGDVYERRNNVLHGSAIPMGMVEGAATILVPAGREPTGHEWSTDLVWTDRREEQKELVSKYMHDTLEQVETAVHNALSSVASKIHDFLRENRVVLECYAAARADVGAAAISVASDPDVRYL